ncbi:MAG: hypothetical protein ACOH5I_04285 [Oligoflexus sp.]
MIRKGIPVRGEISSRYITRSPSEVSTTDLFDKIATKVAKKTAQVKPETGEARGIMLVKSPLSRPDNEFVNDEHRKRLWERIIGKYDHISALLFLDRTSTDAKRSRHVGYFMHRHNDSDMQSLFAKFQALELSELHLKGEINV